MRSVRTLSLVSSLLLLLCALPARAAYPVVSTVTVAGTGSGTDVVNGMVQDASGNLFVAGYLTQSGTGSDIWVAKYDSSLVQLSSWTYDKAGFTDAAVQVALDTTTGNVFVAGFVSSAAANSARDIWIGKFNSSLVLQATVTVNGSGNNWDEANGLRVTGGIVYVVGHSSVTAGKSHWIGRYDTSLNLISTTTLTEFDAYTMDVLPNSAGSIFVAGSRATGPLISVDAWIAKYNSSMVLQSSAAVAGSAGNNDSFYRMADDGAGGVFAVGYLNTATAGDRYIVHYDANLVKISSSLVNGPGNSNEYWQDILVTSSGTLLLAGDQSEAAGAGGVNLLIAEYTSGLALVSSTSYRSSSTGADHASAVLIGTNQDVYAAGYVTEANVDAWLGRFSTSTLYGLVPATGFGGVAVSSLSVQWSWTDASVTEAGYRVMSGAANVSGDLAANTTSWLQTGLTPNTTAGALFARTFNSSGTADAGSQTVYSLSDPPNSITATFYGSSCAFTWPAMANPAYTRWSVERGTDGVSYASQLYFSSAAAAYTDTAMLAGTTYYYRIRSANQDGVYSFFANASAIVYTGNGPAQPSGFAGVAQSTSSILWTWNDNAGTESGYRVMAGATNVSGDLPANTTAWLQTGLAVNTSSGALFAQVFNSTGVANSASVSRYSLSAVPGAPSSSGVGLGAATLSWSANGNPAGVVYDLERSTGTGFGLRQSTAAPSFVDATLSPASTYYYRVRSRNGDLVSSAYSSSAAVVSSPLPVYPAVAAISPAGGTTGASVPATVTGTGFHASATLSLERAGYASGSWAATGSFTQPRFSGALLKLNDGRALLVGGMIEGGVTGLANVDLYDPSTGLWTAKAPMNVGRNQLAAVLLADGRVMVTGGKVPGNQPTIGAEIYDPAANVWTTISSMTVARANQAMVLLPNGKVLVAGGWNGTAAVNSAELYDPATNVWSSAGTMSVVRHLPAMTVLPNGKVLVTGGTDSIVTTFASADLYDVPGNSWTPTGAMVAARHAHKLAVLPDGRVLAAGGANGVGVVNTAELYDPVAGTWSATGSMAAARYFHDMALVGGQAMVLGGENSGGSLTSTEIYDVSISTWRAGPTMTTSRTWTTKLTAVLDDGRVLIAGGRTGLGGGTTLSSAELLGVSSAAIAATGVTVPSASSVTGTFGLAGAATGYWDVVVRELSGRTGRLSGGFLVSAGTPTAPSGFAGAAQSTFSVLWSWTDNSTVETGFRVMNGGGNVSGDLPANTTSWLQTVNGANVSSGTLLVQAFNAAGTSNSGTAARFTLASAPGTPTASAVSMTGATIDWTVNGNSGPTVYELERSTGTGFGLRQASSATASFADTGLTPSATYFYRVRGINSDGIATAYASTLTVSALPYPVLVSIAVAPSAATVAVSSSVLFTAVGTFNDGSTRTLSGQWQSKAGLNEAREAQAGAFSGGKLYVFGGASSPGLPQGSVSSEAYDPAADSWTYRAVSPVRRSYASAAENAGKIYVMGGCLNADCNTLTAAVWEYDTVGDAWAAKTAMPVATFEAAVETIGGKLYAAGGLLQGYASTTTLRVFDPVANTWTAKASMPYARGYAASGVINGKLYVAGGRIDNNGPTGTELQIYDPVADAWTVGAPMPSARSEAGGAVVNGRFYVIGGDFDQLATVSSEAARVQIYDPGSDTWIQGPALKVPRYSATTGAYLGKIYAAAAAYGNNPSSALEVLNPDEASWSSNAPAIGTVTAGGSATGLTPGSASITASSGALNSAGALTVIGLPAAPGSFAGTGSSTGAIQWSWTDNATTETGYRVLSGTISLSGNLAANTTVWLQTGLAANTSAAALLAQAFNSSGTANSATASRFTLAAVPGTPAASGVYQTSGTISWSANGNPAGTPFALERSTGTGYGLQFTGAATSYFDQYLTPGATHFFRVRAFNGDAVATVYSATLAVVAVAPPGVPGTAGTPAGTALGTSSVTWTWVLASGATNHYLFRASDNSFLGSSTSGPFVQTALSPNVPYGLRAAGVNVGGTGPLSPSATVYTWAAAPSAPAVSSAAATALTLTWGLNGNPASTTAEILRSTNAVTYSTLTVVAAATATDADLIGCTTYYYKVRNVNGDGLPTSYVSFQGVTANTVPSPPSAFTAAANSGGTIGLTWSPSPTEGIIAYRLFWDSGSGAVSYAAPIATLGPSAAAYTTGVLTSSASYTFALRAVHRCNVEETTGALAMSGAAVAPPALRAAIKEPDSGKRIHGNRVTILGELIYGTPADAQQILFQYKLAASTGWTNVPAANVNHSNPDLSFPYFVHWNVNLLAPGDYDLRAVAYNRDGVPDAAPPAVRVSVVATGPGADIDENDDNGAVKKEQTIANGVSSVIDTAGAGASDPSVRVTVPAGAVNAATATISVTANPAITTAAPAGQTLVGSAIKIDLSNGQSALNGTAAITLTYPDTVLFPSLLQIYYLNEATGQWSRDFASTVNTSSRTVTGNTPHFSTFALLLGTSFAANLDSVQVYPVPFKPNGPNADEGRPFSTGDPNSGIIFANLAMGSEIKIYTMTGRLVSSLDNAPVTGTIRWDARNQDGRDVASGAYFAVIKASGQKTVVKKLVIIR